jgi:hypothetical protein
MWTEIFSALIELDFDRLGKIIDRFDIIGFFQDPWVIGCVALVSLLMLIRGQFKAMVTFLSIPALLIIFEMTVQGSIDLERSGHKLLLFAGGFLVVAGINVYVHFIRT